MQYRRDVPRGGAVAETIEHVRQHLAGVVSFDDDPSGSIADVTVEVVDHLDGDAGLCSVVGSLDGAPDAPYLRSDYDADADHPEIAFCPFENPDDGQYADHSALRRFRETR